jgi:hypothetical protein
MLRGKAQLIDESAVKATTGEGATVIKLTTVLVLLPLPFVAVRLTV